MPPSAKTLFEANIPRAEKCARQFFRRGKGISFEELRTVALAGLWQAAQRYDGGPGWKTYSWTRMSGHIIDDMRRQSWKTRRGSQYMEYFGSSSQEELAAAGLSEASVEATEPDSVGHENLRRSLDLLPERLRKIVVAVHFEQRPQCEIAQQLGISQGRTSQLLTRALTLLREEVNKNQPCRRIRSATPDSTPEYSSSPKKKRRSPLTKEEIACLIHLENRGWSVTDIAKEQRCTAHTVYRILRSRHLGRRARGTLIRLANVPRRTRTSATDKQRMFDLAKGGLSVAQIALNCARSGKTVRRAIRGLGKFLPKRERLNFTPEQRTRLLELFGTGATSPLIAREFNISVDTVYYLRARFKRTGLKQQQPHPPLTKEERERLNFLVSQGKSTIDISKELCCSPGTVDTWRLDRGQRKCNKNKAITHDQRVGLQEAYRSGTLIREIVKAFNVSRSIVYKYVRLGNIPRTRRYGYNGTRREAA